MNKYGVENFIVEELEYIKDDNKLSEREIYWINELWAQCYYFFFDLLILRFLVCEDRESTWHYRLAG